MAIPTNVRKQGETADQHYELANPEATPDDTKGNPDATGDDPSVDPEKSGDFANQTGTDETPDDPSAPEETVEYWRNRFGVLKGKYDSEVPRLQQENKQLQDKVDELSNRLEQVEQNAEPDVTEVFSEDERHEFGEDSLKLIYKTAQRLAKQQVDSVRDELRQDVDQVRQQAEADRTAEYWRAITEAVPDWETINGDKRFHSWLDGLVTIQSADGGITEVTRQSLLEGYHNQANAEGVIRLFNEFKESLGGQDDRRSERVMPERSAAAAPASEPAKPMLSRQEINQFYADCRRGRYQHDPESRRARELEIESAVQEGRVV